MRASDNSQLMRASSNSQYHNVRPYIPPIQLQRQSLYNQQQRPSLYSQTQKISQINQQERPLQNRLIKQYIRPLVKISNNNNR